MREFWRTWRGWVLLSFFLLLVVVVLAVLAAVGVMETGFGASPADPSQGIDGRRAKTLWDWMELLLVPLALALGAAFFTWVTNKREREIEDQRALAAQKAAEQHAQTEREIAAGQRREAAYQRYLDHMTDLLQEGLKESDPDDEKRGVARARTLAVLHQLDGERKGLLLRFLVESALVEGKAVVVLDGADLRGADLRGAYLVGIRQKTMPGEFPPLMMGPDLHGVDLSEADLSMATLIGADLSTAHLILANLSEADLMDADLTAADLTGADLSEAGLWSATLFRANLTGADLTGANLSKADLTGADLSEADLTGADLSEADLTEVSVSDEQLAQPKTLEGATMPDGRVHK